ncbi:hypothetical protein PMI37_05597, partial [Pseudomonas sp. GM80]
TQSVPSGVTTQSVGTIKQDQKIAACGSSYSEIVSMTVIEIEGLQ